MFFLVQTVWEGRTDRTMGSTADPDHGKGHWWDCEHTWAFHVSDQFIAHSSRTDLVSNSQVTNQQNIDRMMEETG